MTTNNLPTATTLAVHVAKPPSKSAAVIKLLTRARGATVAEMQAATDWQPHSVRAYLSGLRKAGRALDKEERKSGETSYRLGAAPVTSTAKHREATDSSASASGTGTRAASEASA